LLGIERRKTLAQSAKDAEREAQLVAFQIEVESNQMTDAELAAVGVRLQELLRTAEKCRARAALYDHFKLGIPQVQFKRVLN
jgi:hypothetical protein